MVIIGPAYVSGSYIAESGVRQEAGEDAEQGPGPEGYAVAVPRQYPSMITDLRLPKAPAMKRPRLHRVSICVLVSLLREHVGPQATSARGAAQCSHSGKR